MTGSGLKILAIRTLVVGIFQISCGHPAFAQQTPPERQINATGYGPSIENATKNALSNAVAAICGQRIIGTQNLDNQSKTQTAIDKSGKNTSFEQSKIAQDNVNSISDGLIEKFQVLDQREWNDQKKVDVSVTVSKCYNLDSIPEVAQTNKLLSSILKKMDENSDPRGIKEGDDKWDVMAKEMSFTSFAAYKRIGQFETEDQAKFAISKGYKNLNEMHQAQDKKIIDEWNQSEYFDSYEHAVQLLSGLSINSTKEHDSNIENLFDSFKNKTRIELILYVKCKEEYYGIESAADTFLFIWGDNASSFEEPPYYRISRHDNHKVMSLCSITEFEYIGMSTSAAEKLLPVCDQYNLFQKALRARKVLDWQLKRTCQTLDSQWSEALSKAEDPKLSAKKRKEILREFNHSQIMSDFLNIQVILKIFDDEANEDYTHYEPFSKFPRPESALKFCKSMMELKEELFEKSLLRVDLKKNMTIRSGNNLERLSQKYCA